MTQEPHGGGAPDGNRAEYAGDVNGNVAPPLFPGESRQSSDQFDFGPSEHQQRPEETRSYQQPPHEPAMDRAPEAPRESAPPPSAAPASSGSTDNFPPPPPPRPQVVWSSAPATESRPEDTRRED